MRHRNKSDEEPIFPSSTTGKEMHGGSAASTGKLLLPILLELFLMGVLFRRICPRCRGPRSSLGHHARNNSVLYSASILYADIHHQVHHQEAFGGFPICFVSAGIRDMAIPNLTLAASAYLANVEWYLQLLLKQTCYHILWVQNTVPKSTAADQHTYAQTQELILEWNQAVYSQQQQNNSNETTNRRAGFSFGTSLSSFYESFKKG